MMIYESNKKITRLLKKSLLKAFFKKQFFQPIP